MSITREEVVQIANQVAQQTAQSVAEQVIQATQQTGGSLSADKKVLGVTHMTNDISVDEAFNSKTYTDSELWGFDKKQIAVSEQTERVRSIDFNSSLRALELKEKELAIAEREAKLRKQAQLDSIEISERQNAAVVSHMLNTFSIDFRTSAAHPFSPNDGENKNRK